MSKTSHIHKLKRHSYKSGTAVYFCTLDCNYKISSALALGKKTICWRCNEEFIMNEYSMRLAKPHCEKCHSPKGSKKIIDMIDKVPYYDMSHATDGLGNAFTVPEQTLPQRLEQLLQSKQRTEEEDEI